MNAALKSAYYLNYVIINLVYMDINKTLKYLYSFERRGIKLNLENIRMLLKKVGNPEKRLKIVHVAGTNGKGSVCAMLSSILKEAGYKVGMYTSPHLKRFNERIRINDNLVTNKEIASYFLRIKPHITNQTFFEITTAMAFIYFYEKNVDIAVLETGLGGRLDATNVIKPLVSVITNIGIEHTDYLGNTIKKIAYEKAGIIKKNIPVITGAKGSALKVIKETAKRKNAPLVINKKYKKNIDTFAINNYKNLKLDFLKGDFQLENAATAVTTIDALNRYYNLKINKNNVRDGLKKAKWRGRLQYIRKNILIDCAHNPAGFKALIRELKKIKCKKLILVIGILKDKDIKKIIKMLNPIADYFIITKPKSERAAEPEFIAQYIKKEFKIINDSRKALDFAKKIAGRDDLIAVAGSIYLVGEIM